MKFEEIRSNLIKERRKLLPKLQALESRFYRNKSAVGLGNAEDFCSCNDDLLNLITEMSEIINKYRNEFDKFLADYPLTKDAKIGKTKRFYRVLYRIFLPVNFNFNYQYMYDEIWKFFTLHDTDNCLRYVFTFDNHDASRYQLDTADLTFYKDYSPDNKMYSVYRWDQFEEDLANFVVK